MMQSDVSGFKILDKLIREEEQRKEGKGWALGHTNRMQRRRKQHRSNTVNAWAETFSYFIGRKEITYMRVWLYFLTMIP